MWFTQQRKNRCLLSGPILQEKALLFRKEFEDDDENFTASLGSFDKGEKRYDIRQLKICGEKLSADFESVVKFCKKLQEVVKNENLTDDQLHNCDETGLNFKMLPSKTLASREEKNAPVHKKAKRVEQDDSEEENPADSTPLMSHSEGLAELQSAMRYVEQQPGPAPADNMLLG
ncbi:hypothetical protein AVEN_35001-1 [Araneus ventricosus]|nr:hypothetical protein AVEN_35001-1 [Araneus ventricosus]